MTTTSTTTTNERPSLADVAKLAGVSSQTVSRVVRGADVVAKDTRERVLAIVAELGYQPNLAARSLSQRRTGVVHVVNATPLFHGHARTFLEVVGALGELDLHTSMSVLPFGEDLTLNRLIPMGVDGVVILGGHSRSSQWAEVAETRVPVVFVGQRVGLPPTVSSVGVDQAHGALLATRHLIEQGRTKLMHICGPRDWLDAEERRNGFVEACDEAGIAFEKISSPTWDAQSAYDATSSLPPGIDGVFASNDHLALGLLRRLHENGVTVPEDISVIGFDDADGSDCFWPPLSTVRQPFRAVGHAAVAQLTRLMDGGSPEHSLIQPELIVRGSSKGHT
ncbi:LacI family DNA-binding transcriptional regulator [Tessaracoccus antarcticus]|uniref:LacI family transcriptional regulator n=1 Tax=Tessaracoccus antarcticus TaxID=2479848 RepID=A0A3M0GL38_9ACTN|nr:LacI family DNA-binding transcriptional regulator [Tessaracoccus antarcticus]RMB61859.1 LacI family transcriptional regulator [Tessaracoccus antarcticus]